MDAINAFRKSIRDEHFQISSSFMTNIMYSELDIEKECDLPDTMMLRALMVFMAYGMVKVWKYSMCKSSCTVRSRDPANSLYWM